MWVRENDTRKIYGICLKKRKTNKQQQQKKEKQQRTKKRETVRQPEKGKKN